METPATTVISPILSSQPGTNPVCLSAESRKLYRHESFQNKLDNTSSGEPNISKLNPQFASSFLPLSPLGKSLRNATANHLTNESPFPFPETTAYDDHLDRSKTLMYTLKILKLHKYISAELETLETSSNSVSSGAKQKKQIDKLADENSGFEFTQDMFYTSNFEASSHALHLMFSTLDSGETTRRFRDAWPLYDKKMESSFRKVSVHWWKELLKHNPAYFDGLQEEAIGGLIMNAGGERFIYHLNNFCTYVLYMLVSKTKTEGDDIILYCKPQYTGDDEITQRQILLLSKWSLKYSLYLKTLRCNLIKSAKTTKTKLSSLTTRVNEFNADMNDMKVPTEESAWAALSADQKALLAQLVQSMNTEPLEKKLLAFTRSKSEKYHSIIKDSLASEAQTILTCRNIFQRLSEFYQNYTKLWYILSRNFLQGSEIDGRRLTFHLTTRNGSFELYLQKLSSCIHQLCNNRYFKGYVEDWLIRDLKHNTLQFDCSKIIHNDHRLRFDTFGTKIDSVVQDHQSARLQFQGIDWSELSHLNVSSYKEKLLTPPRKFDSNENTGLTPGILGFLCTPRGDTAHKKPFMKNCRNSLKRLILSVSRERNSQQSPIIPNSRVLQNLIDGESCQRKLNMSALATSNENLSVTSSPDGPSSQSKDDQNNSGDGEKAQENLESSPRDIILSSSAGKSDLRRSTLLKQEAASSSLRRVSVQSRVSTSTHSQSEKDNLYTLLNEWSGEKGLFDMNLSSEGFVSDSDSEN